MIDLSKNGHLWRITIDRPEKANSLTSDMLGEILDIVTRAQDMASVLVITGEGNVFSAGADLAEIKAGLATDPVWEQLSGAIVAFPGLSIAALNGTLAGGAFGMALACDIRIASETASAFYPVMKLGVLPQPSDPARLSAIVGPAKASMILLGGQKIDANSALAWGLFDKVVPSDDLPGVVQEVAAHALGADREHVVAIKRLFGRSDIA